MLILLRCFNKGFLFTFYNFLPPEANVLRLVPYAYSHVTSCGPQSILYLLSIVDQNGYAPHKDIIGEQRYRSTNS